MSQYGVIFSSVGIALISMLASASEPVPSAGDLFAIVSAARASARAEQIVDPGAFAREMLEDTLRRVDTAARHGHSNGLDWERDALLTGLSGLQAFDTVYAFELRATHVDP